ncbi:hypothetical protein D5S18_03950 [Nocardia panacis]|uniref:Uncharacterized protein n=1 Tax=Nocardia panacis TaxID=2340916 RepID=A0A3A4KAH2_9NOCA|nr:hypothetical protein D5S18_03950 [Nocardia panacis]
MPPGAPGMPDCPGLAAPLGTDSPGTFIPGAPGTGLATRPTGFPLRPRPPGFPPEPPVPRPPEFAPGPPEFRSRRPIPGTAPTPGPGIEGCPP